MHTIFLLAIMAITVVSSGCATKQRWEINDAFKKPASEIYITGTQAVKMEDYDTAIRQFKSLEVFYPDSPYTNQALLDLSHAYYKNNSFSSAIAAADRFIQTYPDHTNIDYAYYIKGLASFKQAVEELDVVPDAKMPANSPSALQSLQHFSSLLSEHPDSTYKNDSQQRITYLNERLAQRELSLATFYIQQGSYANAALHAKIILEKYPQSPSAPEAVSLTNEAYHLLKFDQAPLSYPGDINNTDNTIPDPELMPDIVPAENPLMMDEPTLTDMLTQEEHPVEMNYMADIRAQAEAPVGLNEIADMLAQEESPVEKSHMEAMDAIPVDMSETIPMTAADKFKRESWLIAQDPGHFTLQIIGTHNETQLTKLIENNQTEYDIAYFKSIVDNKPWFSLVYGVFSTIESAKKALNELPDSLNRHTPWVRSFRDIHTLVNQTNDH